MKKASFLVEAALICAVGLPIGFFFIGLSMVKSSDELEVMEGCLIMLLCVLSFIAGTYAIWRHSEYVREQELQTEVAAHEAAHLARYERPFEAMADNSTPELEEADLCLSVMRQRLREISQNREDHYQQAS